MQPALELGSVQDRRRGGARRLELLPRDGNDSVKFGAELIPYATIVRGQPLALVRGGGDVRGERGLDAVQLFLQRLDKSCIRCRPTSAWLGADDDLSRAKHTHTLRQVFCGGARNAVDRELYQNTLYCGHFWLGQKQDAELGLSSPGAGCEWGGVLGESLVGARSAPPQPDFLHRREDSCPPFGGSQRIYFCRFQVINRRIKVVSEI